ASRFDPPPPELTVSTPEKKERDKAEQVVRLDKAPAPALAADRTVVADKPVVVDKPAPPRPLPEMVQQAVALLNEDRPASTPTPLPRLEVASPGQPVTRTAASPPATPEPVLTAPGKGPGTVVRMVNSKKITLNFEVKNSGPSGVAA